MSEIGKHKLSDAVPGPAKPEPNGGNPTPTHETVAEQQREAEENRQAHEAQGGLRDRLVDNGKAHHMAGRGNGRKSDQ